nr:Imm42 family immunity protein [Pantoea agglomerans]
MIFGEPYRFAIWIECIPQWSQSYKMVFLFFYKWTYVSRRYQNIYIIC